MFSSKYVKVNGHTDNVFLPFLQRGTTFVAMFEFLFNEAFINGMCMYY